MSSPFTWQGLGQWMFITSAFAFLLLIGWRWDGRRRKREQAGWADITAFAVIAAWSLVAAANGPTALVGQVFETLRSLALLGLTLALFTRDGRHTSVGPIRPVIASLVFVELLQLLLVMMQFRFGRDHGVQEMILQISGMFRLLVAIGGLVLVHNLYAGAIAHQRTALRWTCAALATLWGYDLNLYTIAYLSRQLPMELAALRGLAQIAAAGLLVIGAVRGRSATRFSPSRAVAFQSLSLMVIGAYMIVMVGAAQSLAWLGGNASQLAHLGFVFVSSVLVLAVMPSGKVRGWIKVMLAKHFFQHRYDYRAEWLRFTRTIGRAGSQTPPLHERVVQAVADITDSSAGLLLVPAESGELVLASRWQWPTADVPAKALGAGNVPFFEKRAFIVDLDEVRAGVDHQGEIGSIPVWMLEEHSAWALVPLLHFDRL